MASERTALRVVILASLAGWLWLSGAGHAQTFTADTDLRRDFWDTDGTVFSVVATNGRVYLGGSFNYLAPKGRKVSSFDVFTGTSDTEFPAIHGAAIHAILADGNGGWYVGGEFTAAGNYARTNVVHIRGDRSVDPDFHPDPDGSVWALALAEDILYVAGDFTRFGGQTRRKLAALNLLTGQATAWNPDANGRVSALALNGSAIYAGGLFTQIGRRTQARLAALDLTSGDATSWSPFVNGAVLALALAEDRVFLGGSFNSVGGHLRNGLASVDVFTAGVTSWDPNPDGGTVATLALACNTLYLGGSFKNVNGVARLRAAAVDVNSAQVLAWNPNLAPTYAGTALSIVRSLVVAGDTVYLGGSFAGGGNPGHRDLAAADALTGEIQPWNPSAAGGVSAVAAFANQVLAGFVTTPGGVARKNFAALDVLTGRPLDWNPDPDGAVLAMAVNDDVVFIGGSFTNVGGLARPRLAALDATSGEPTDWTPTPDDAVRALVLTGDTLYAGGNFSSINGTPRDHLAAFVLTSGQLVPTWTPNADSTVYALAVAGDLVYVGGSFNYVGGKTRNSIAALSASTGLATTWNPNLDNRVRALVIANGTVFAGGSFLNAGGFARSRLAALDVNTGASRSWNLDADAEVRTLALADDTLYVGGDFLNLGGLPRKGLAALSVTSGLPLSWNPGDDDGNRIHALAPGENLLLAAGVSGLHFTSAAPDFSFAAFLNVGAPRLLTVPRSQTVLTNGQAMFSVGVTGQASVFFQWRLDGIELLNATNDMLTVSNLLASDAGIYQVIVSNQLGVASAEATLTVVEPVQILQQPVGFDGASTTNVTLRVTATGQPAPLFQWRRNGVNIPGAVSATLVLSNGQPRDGGSYSVVMANPAGAVNSDVVSVRFAAAALAFKNNFTNAVVLTAASGVGSGENRGESKQPGEPDHAGKRGGSSVWIRWSPPASGIATFDTRGSSFDTLLAVYTGPSISNLVAVAADEDRGGFLTSQVSFNAEAGVTYHIAVDGFAGATGDIVLSWNLDTAATPFPKMLLPPLSQSVSIGATAEFVVLATSPTPMSYQWFFGCREIPGATNDTLIISNMRRANVGSYRVVVMNSSSRIAESAPVSLEIGPVNNLVSQDKLEDLFPSPDGSGPALSDAGGTSAFFSVSVGAADAQNLDNSTGTVSPSEPNLCGNLGGASQWLRLRPVADGTMMIDTLGSSIDTVLAVYTGSNFVTLRIVACDDNGAPDHIRSLVRFPARHDVDYAVGVDGVNRARGPIRVNWQLGVAPSITSPPGSELVRLGGSVFFNTEVANLTGDTRFQWQLNGVNIPGATSRAWSLPGVQLANAGNYSLVVSNFAGQVTNLVKALTIEVPYLRAEPALHDGTFRFWLSALPNQAVVMQSSTNLRDWVSFSTNQPTVPTMFIDFSALGTTRRFFRAIPPK